MKEILISSSVLILVLAAARHLLRGKVSRRLQYGFWLLVALRLLIPIQFGQSDYSVAALTEKVESQSTPIRQLQESLREPVSGPSRTELYEQFLDAYLQTNADPVEPEVQSPVTPEIREQIEAQVEEQLTVPTLSEVLTAIWIVGMALMALWFLVTNLTFLLRARRNSKVWKATAPIRVRISPNVPSPCLAGLFRPVIYLTPASTQDETALAHILTHELTHLRHWDHIWSVLRCVCLCVYWFDPLVWLAAILSKRDCELACDEAALKKLGDDQRIAYGKTLLATVTQSHSPAHILETATAMNETKKQLKERVNQIVKKPKTLLTAALALILITALAAGCAFAGSKSTEPTATEPPVTQTQQTEPTIPPTDPPTVTDPTEPQPTSAAAKPRFINLYPSIIRDFRLIRTEIRNSRPPAEDLTLVRGLIKKYNLFQLTSIFCDCENVDADMSEFLTDEQKESYRNYQHRITCCQTVEEVNAHTARMIDPSLIRRLPDDRLFWDDEGDLYLTGIPTGTAGYSVIQEIYPSDTQTVVLADYGYDDYEHSAIIILELRDGTWMIRSILPFDETERAEGLEAEAYRWLLEELPGILEDGQTEAYGQLLVDAFFAEPETFLTRLSALDESAISPITDLLRKSPTAEERPLYARLLEALDAHTDLTDEERNILATLSNN